MLPLACGKLPAWTGRIGRFWFTKIGAIVAKQDGRPLRRIGLNSDPIGINKKTKSPSVAPVGRRPGGGRKT